MQSPYATVSGKNSQHGIWLRGRSRGSWCVSFGVASAFVMCWGLVMGLPCHLTNRFGFQGITKFVFVNKLSLKSLMRSLYRPPLWPNNEKFLVPKCVFSGGTHGFSLKWTVAWFVQVTVYWDFFLRRLLNALWKGLSFSFFFFFPACSWGYKPLLDE